ncbi:MAG: class I SAM-dependent methyltransferase [Pseudonocardiaceae bacterium]
MGRPPATRAFRPLPDKTSTRDYEPSYDLGGTFATEGHARAEELVADVPGWLRPEDALKLYELAYCAEGPILEIGTYRGKSGTLMALATRDAGSPVAIVSVDVDPGAQRDAAAVAVAKGVGDRLWLVRGTAAAFFASNPSFTPSLVFLDGDHSYAAVRRDLAVVEPHIPSSGLLLLHDYLDPRNDDPSDEEFEVFRAAGDSWLVEQCEFAGTFGACGLFRRTQGGSERPTVGAFDLRRYDSPRLQYLQRVRWPAGRALRRAFGRSRT